MGRKERDLGIFLVISVLFFTIFIGTALRNTSDAIPGGNIRPSMNHPTIYLDGNAALDAFPDKTGSGNATDPYLIQGLEIGASGNDSCIFLNNTDRFLIINECNLSKNMYGIRLYNCANIEIVNCSIENNHWAGIFLESSHEINITTNNIEGSFLGCECIGVFDVIIQGNVIYNNTNGLALFYTVIYINTTLPDPVNFKILGNTITYNDYIGIYLLSNGNIIYNNEISFNGGYGMEVYGENNEIYGNTFNMNGGGCIHEYFGAHNSIHDNECILHPSWYALHWFLPAFLIFILGMLIVVAVRQKRVIIPNLSSPIDVPFLDEGWGKKFGKRLQGYIPLAAILIFTTFNYFFTIEFFKPTSLYYLLTKMATITIYNIFLAILTFYMTRRALVKLTLFSIFLGIICYVVPMTVGYRSTVLSEYHYTWEMLVFIVFSIITPGITMLILDYLKQIESNRDLYKSLYKRFLKKIHVHESFLGMVFFLLAFILLVPREIAEMLDVHEELFTFMDVTISVASFTMLFTGAFTISRDWHDFTSKIFVEKNVKEGRWAENYLNVIDFNVCKDKFFPGKLRTPKRLIMMICISTCMSLIWNSYGLVPWPIFNVSFRILALIGYSGAVALGSLLGYMEAHVKPYQYFLTPK